MNYLQIVQRLKRESARSGAAITTLTGLSANDQRLADWAADAWLELERREHGWDWQRRSVSGPMVIGQRAYRADELDPNVTDFGRWLPPATDDYEVTAELNPGEPWALRWLPWELFRSRFELRTAVDGAPAYWTIAPDKRVHIGPTPDDAYTLRLDYLRAPVPLVNDTDEPEGLPAEFHTMLIWRALMELASFDAAPEVYARAEKNLEALEADLFHRHGPKVGFAKTRL